MCRGHSCNCATPRWQRASNSSSRCGSSADGGRADARSSRPRRCGRPSRMASPSTVIEGRAMAGLFGLRHQRRGQRAGGQPAQRGGRRNAAQALTGLVLSTILLLIVGPLMWLVVRSSLKPVVALEAAMRSRRRFDLTPLPVAALPRELHPLVASFNRLLEQLAESIEGERRFIGDAAHELRTPLGGAAGAGPGRPARDHRRRQGRGTGQAASASHRAARACPTSCWTWHD